MSPGPLAVERLGRLPYPQAEARMLALLEARIADRAPDTLLLVEPDPVFTVGRRKGAQDNVLAPGQVPVVPAARGGDVTFHGPGQVVGWPVVALPEGRRDLHLWLHGLEHVVIGALARFGLEGQRDARNTGVWLGGRKVCAVGVGCRRWVAWHGFALNVTTDLAWFQRIQPCGLPRDTVTRLADHLDPAPSWEDVALACADELSAWWTGPDPAAAVAACLARRPPRGAG
ncbi:lipoyl(octanoyl) transferase LipB [Myxococcota bacterium]|nr:lipoyl(octanoyl) transferase LipB [Myxococcota bacterium]